MKEEKKNNCNCEPYHHFREGEKICCCGRTGNTCNCKNCLEIEEKDRCEKNCKECKEQIQDWEQVAEEMWKSIRKAWRENYMFTGHAHFMETIRRIREDAKKDHYQLRD